MAWVPPWVPPALWASSQTWRCGCCLPCRSIPQAQLAQGLGALVEPVLGPLQAAMQQLPPPEAATPEAGVRVCALTYFLTCFSTAGHTAVDNPSKHTSQLHDAWLPRARSMHHAMPP